MNTFLSIMGYALLIGVGITALAALGVFTGNTLAKALKTEDEH
jgi:hypothetical protein